jgi:pyridoxal phosphate enzyme (YggS family)
MRHATNLPFPHNLISISHIIFTLTNINFHTDKSKPLSSTLPNLHTVSSIDTPKKATQLNIGRSTFPDLPPLNIHIQLNTSNEASKSGVSPGSDASALATHIIKECPHLKLAGLMTIGAIARSKATGEGEENEDFKILREERDWLEEELGDGWKGKLELSMGMSEDFEGAVGMGSDEVRVGSTIFGTRPKKEDFKVKGDVEGEKS